MTEQDPLHPYFDPPPADIWDFWFYANRAAEVFMAWGRAFGVLA